jgi:hypothetical protein
MLVFFGGTWHAVELPFSDPLLSTGHLQYAASVYVVERSRGATEQQAINRAEQRMYEQMYSGLRIAGE